MPAVVVAIGAAIGGTAGAFMIMYATQIVAGAMLLGSLAMSSAQKRKAERKARAQYNAAQVDRLVNVATTVAPRELVLGRVRKGGHVFFRGSSGGLKEKFTMLVALAGHEIDAVEQIYLNDVPVERDADGWVLTAPYLLQRVASGFIAGDGAVPPEAIPSSIGPMYSGSIESRTLIGTLYQYYVPDYKARVRSFLGVPGQAAAAPVMADFPGLWTAAHTASGCAYLLCEFWYDETAFPTGLPNVTARVRGARCHDPRTSLTAWTENPAIHQRHVLLHPMFGKRTSLTVAEEARIVAAANACDTTIDYGGSVGEVPMYRSATVIPYGTAARDALDDLTQAMAGQWAYAAGEFHTRAGVYTAPVLSLTEQDLAVVKRDGTGSVRQQPIAISTHRARADKLNVISPRIWDNAQDYKQVVLPPLKAPSLIARDGAELMQEVDMPCVFLQQQAQHIAGILLRDSRDPLTVTLPFKLSAYGAELFDAVEISLPRYGWDAKAFMVVGRQWSLDGLIVLTLKETAAAIYDPAAAFLAVGHASNTALPRPWDIEPPTGLAADSGTSQLLVQADGTVVSRVRVSWNPITDATVRDSGSVEVQWAHVEDGVLVWHSVRATATDTALYLNGVADGLDIALRARTRNSVAVSNWGPQFVHTVVGKSEPPPPFDTFQVLAQPDGTRQYNFAYTSTTVPADWAGAEIRYIAGTEASPDWAAMQPLHDEHTYYTASPIEANAPISGMWTFACRSRDTSGNLSTLKVVSIDLPRRRSGSVYAEVAHDPAWPGTLTDFVLIGGVLEGVSSATWGTLPSTWDGWSAWADPAASPASYTCPPLDLESEITGQLDAVVGADGTALTEIRTGPDGSTWSAWGAASDVFTARWVQVRVTVSATGGAPVPTLRSVAYNVSAELQTEYINDVDISALTGDHRIGTGDVRAPLEKTYVLIRQAIPVIQDSRSGAWTYTRLDKDTSVGPRFRFYLDGVLTDPDLVDFLIEGI